MHMMWGPYQQAMFFKAKSYCFLFFSFYVLFVYLFLFIIVITSCVSLTQHETSDLKQKQVSEETEEKNQERVPLFKRQITPESDGFGFGTLCTKGRVIVEFQDVFFSNPFYALILY